jgi:hypothetical protein
VCCGQSLTDANGRLNDRGGGPRQPHPGTRCHHYGCSLPGLTGFAVSRCEGTGADHHKKRAPCSGGSYATLAKR